MLAAHHCLDNLIVILDHNGLQIDGGLLRRHGLGDVAAKWRAFGWEVRRSTATTSWRSAAPWTRPHPPSARPNHRPYDQGEGRSLMENNVDFHGKAPTPEEMERALKEIEGVD